MVTIPSKIILRQLGELPIKYHSAINLKLKNLFDL